MIKLILEFLKLIIDQQGLLRGVMIIKVGFL